MKEKLKIVTINCNYPDYKIEEEILSSFSVEFEHLEEVHNYEKISKKVKNADAILVRETELSTQLIEGMKDCKVIVRYGVGIDNIDLDMAKKKEIYIANVPDYGSEEVADHAIALFMTLSRRIVSRDRDVRNGIWGVGPAEKMYSFKEQVVGIVGYGRIGKTFKRKILGLGFKKILVHDPFYKGNDSDIELVELETLCERSDIISLHLPMFKNNSHLLNKELMEKMKKNLILINTSRGGLIDEVALAEVLNENKIMGAGIDVFEKEPIDTGSPLLSSKNTILTDHTGWYSEESLTELKRKAANEIARVFMGERPKNWVNNWEDKNDS